MEAKISSFFERNAVSFKVLLIAVLVLLLLIPMSMIESLINEREDRKAEVISEIASKWGQQQTIIGPVLSIPYLDYFEDEDGNRRQTIKSIYVLPETLDVSASIVPNIRYRGIYKAVLYESKINLKGRFSLSAFRELNIPESRMMPSQASIVIGLSDIKGISENLVFHLDDNIVTFNPGGTGSAISSGVSAKVGDVHDLEGRDFSATITLNGSLGFYIAPIGLVTTASIESSWPNPSFDGAFLPVEREVLDSGFKASWKVLHFNRNYPQSWIGEQYHIQKSEFGVRLLITADIYQQSIRIAKYALMFIGFTFLSFFFSEIMNKTRIHPIQYLLIGFALIIFYTLLIAISEHLTFDAAYLISSASIIMLITIYASGILKSMRLSLMVGGILTILYFYLYILLQLESYALLLGSIGLFVVLSLVMYMTRQIDWYNMSETDKKDS